MDALVKRGVPLLNDGDSLCVLCKSHPETATHLFSSCNFSYSVWQLIYNWLARNDFVFNNTKPSLHQILNSIKVKSWFWTKAQLGKEPIHFDDWTSKPLDCIHIDL
ncbi:hypothetical protein Lal_00020348 [Lupinus albus]|nr:hypothetical protein Lal_00020348 [Lupinus albus]